jgi:hypothetical protein
MTVIPQGGNRLLVRLPRDRVRFLALRRYQDDLGSMPSIQSGHRAVGETVAEGFQWHLTNAPSKQQQKFTEHFERGRE